MFLFKIELSDPNSQEYMDLVSNVLASHTDVFCDGTYPDCSFEVTGFQKDDTNLEDFPIIEGFKIVWMNQFKMFPKIMPNFLGITFIEISKVN